MIRPDGWLEGVDRHFTYHQRPRRKADGSTMTCVVIHATAGDGFESAIDTMKDRGVSAHFLIGKDGRLAQLVPTERIAYHAGPSAYGGRKSVNGFGVGIELVARPIKNLREAYDGGGYVWDPVCKWWAPPYPEAQIAVCARVCAAVMRKYSIAAKDVVGHAEVSPGRKFDPYIAFPWEGLHQQIDKELENA